MSDAADPLLGSVLGGYRLVEPLGAGGAGAVYRSEDAAGASWAVKVLHASAGARERAAREVEVAARVAHPNVARTVTSGEDQGRLFVVMEFVPGISLAQALAVRSPLPVGDVIRIGAQLLDALGAAHAAGIVHRDVKPANILIHRAAGAGRESLTAKLADFGIALLRDRPDLETAPENSVVGTPAYLAPEQWANPTQVDGRDDLYSLGCTLFEALCGRKPFAPSGGEDLHWWAYQHQYAPRPDLSALRPLPPELAQLVESLLEPDPTKRPSDAPVLAARLRALLDELTADEEVVAYDRPAGQPPETGLPPADVREESADVDRSPPPTGEGEPVSSATEKPTLDFPDAPRQREAVTQVGPYRLVRLLWRDFCSEMHEAEDTVLGVATAVEILNKSFRVDRDVGERFRRRAHAGARVNHPNVHKTYSFHEDPVPYCVLEPLRGRLLADRIGAGSPLALAEILDVAEQALLGLHAVHSCGLLHRDVKSRNLFLQDDDVSLRRSRRIGLGRRAFERSPVVVKLLGLDLVKDTVAASTLTAEGETMGTAMYMAPELITRGARAADPRTDLYSLGCVFFEMTCGRLPFTIGTSAIETLLQHLEAEIPDPRQYRPDIPAAWAVLIRRLLAKDPNDRYASAADILEEVARITDSPDTREALPPPTDPASGETAQSKTTAAGPLAADYVFSSETVVIHYPAPVALAYRRFCREGEPRARLERLFFAVEAAARYLVTLGVCDLLGSLATSDGDDLTLPAHPVFDFLRRPRPMQLGLWIEALRETARALAGHEGRALVELAEVCAPGGEVDGVLGRLVQLRNACVHAEGSIPATPDECEAAVLEARPVLDELLGLARFVLDYPLGFVTRGLDLDRGGRGQSYYLHSCMGAAVQRTAEAYHIQTDVVLREATPFVVTGKGTRLLYLWPLLGQRVSAVHERHTLYVFEDLPDRSWPYLSAVRSAAIDVRDEWRQRLHSQPAAGHGWLLGRLREFREAACLPEGLDVCRRLMPWRGGALTGLSLDGNRLRAPVGRGGFGTIYAATAPGGETVAVKVLETAAVSGRHVRRFRREFQRLRDLAPHPGIIRCHAEGVLFLDGRVYPWYSMEFALGGDLNGRIEERRSGRAGLPPWNDSALQAQIAGEFRQVVEAVAHLHDSHLVHRDLKPSNVLVMADGTLRLSDFGLAKNLGRSEGVPVSGPPTSAGAVLGTRHYMAPEQEKGQPVTETADVYALGILLAELAVGDRPRTNTGVSAGSTLQGWRRLNSLPEPLRHLLARLTAVVPEQRPANARIVGEEFEALNVR